MQASKCPNCGKDIELVSAKDLDEEFNISANALQHAREKGNFPSPWLSFGNRNIWLRAAILDYAASRSEQRLEKVAGELAKNAENMPPEERKALVARLSEALGVK